MVRLFGDMTNASLPSVQNEYVPKFGNCFLLSTMKSNFLFNFTIIMGRHSPNIITRKEILPGTWHPFEDKLIYQPKINKSGFLDLLGNNLSYGGCLVNNWPTAVFEKKLPTTFTSTVCLFKTQYGRFCQKLSKK